MLACANGIDEFHATSLELIGVPPCADESDSQNQTDRIRLELFLSALSLSWEGREGGNLRIINLARCRPATRLTEGPFTNDVQSEGKWGWPNSDQRKGGCVNLVLTRGVQNPKKFR